MLFRWNDRFDFVKAGYNSLEMHADLLRLIERRAKRSPISLAVKNLCSLIEKENYLDLKYAFSSVQKTKIRFGLELQRLKCCPL